jgi:hypothetical protein
MKGYGFKFIKKANMVSQRWSPAVAVIDTNVININNQQIADL